MRDPRRTRPLLALTYLACGSLAACAVPTPTPGTPTPEAVAPVAAVPGSGRFGLRRGADGDDRAVTGFHDALRCLDDLLLAHNKRAIAITTAGMPDLGGKPDTNSKRLVVSALARTSIRSKAFRYIDYDSERGDLDQLLADIGRARRDQPTPAYYLHGSISQADEDAGAVVSVSLAVARVPGRTPVDGASASNAIAVPKAGMVAGGRIADTGQPFSIAMHKSEGRRQAIRALIELGMVEVLGKLAEVPYRRCLPGGQAEAGEPADRS